MVMKIRPATLADANNIAQLIEIVFGDQPSIHQISLCQILDDNYTYVAVIDGTVVGFVDNFITVSKSRQVRLELDLLAVHPDFQGQGLGKQLIEHSLQLARQLQVHYVRALIAEHNQPMRHICRKLGGDVADELSQLYVLNVDQGSDRLLADISNTQLITVYTLTYSGIWIDGRISKSVILSSLEVAYQRQLDIVGVVLPASDNETIDLLTHHGFGLVGNYHYWLFSL